jgi:hypothetical protein
MVIEPALVKTCRSQPASTYASPDAAGRAQADEELWLGALRKEILQSPLIESRPSFEALTRCERRTPPKAVFLGIGICTRDRVSGGVPFDLLGVLLPAERIRRAIGAAKLVVAIADRHALTNGLERSDVYRRSREVERLLATVRDRLGLTAMTVVRASGFHGSPEYRAARSLVEQRADGTDHPYFKSEVADIEFFNRAYGGILKVGWTVGRSTRSKPKRDEVAFDRRFQRWMGGHVAFVYCKAGRSLSDRRPKGVPYTAVDPAMRICLTPDEDVAEKLATCSASPPTVKGVRNHLRAVTRAYSQTVRPLTGPVESRAQEVIDTLFSDSG